MDVRVFDSGGYRFINAVFQYSGGVAAEPGHHIVRVRLSRPLPIKEGFRLVESTLRIAGIIRCIVTPSRNAVKASDRRFYGIPG